MNVIRVNMSNKCVYHSKDLNQEKVIDFFLEDLERVLYIFHIEQQKIGILTLGDFLRSGTYSDEIINYDFFRVDEKVEKDYIIKIFEERTNINRIPIMNETEVRGEWRREQVENREYTQECEERFHDYCCKIKNMESAIANYLILKNIKVCYALSYKSYNINNILQYDFKNLKLCNLKDIYNLSTQKDYLLIIYDNRIKELLYLKGINGIWLVQFLEEVCQLELINRVVEKFDQLNIPVYYFRGPEQEKCPEDLFTEQQKNRINNNLSVMKMTKDFQTYKEDLKEIYGELFNKQYILEVSSIPPIVRKIGKVEHVDHSSKYMNVVGGGEILLGSLKDIKGR